MKNVRNFVQKHAVEFNKPQVFVDRKKRAKNPRKAKYKKIGDDYVSN